MVESLRSEVVHGVAHIVIPEWLFSVSICYKGTTNIIVQGLVRACGFILCGENMSQLKRVGKVWHLCL